MATNQAFIQIRKTSELISSVSNQVAGGAQSLAQGSVEQAGSLESLVATIGDIAEQEKDNTENAAWASKRAVLVGSEMVRCNEKMQEMIQAMSEISNRSDEIGKIIKTIEDIAFQTNILALNAAVEAARAAQNTTVFIQDSMNAVAYGAKIAQETAALLKQSVHDAREVTGKIESIATATERQMQSIEMVKEGAGQIAAVVQSNSAVAEESAATSEELFSQTHVMDHLIEHYTLSE